MKEEIMTNLRTLWGLFFPYRYGGKWQFTFVIGGIPLGWLIVIIASFV